MGAWPEETPDLLRLPSGRTVRGRGLRQGSPAGPPPEFGLYLLGRPPRVEWASRWVRWPDLWLPADPSDARDAFAEALRRAGDERVEVCCAGGNGRTGTALACLAVLDGVPPAEAVAYVRAGYRTRAVEMPWQRRFVAAFRA